MQRSALFKTLDHLPQRERLLLEAVEAQDLAAVQQQLAAGADVSAAAVAGSGLTGVRGITALHAAAATAQGPIVAALLAAGADVAALCALYGHEDMTVLEYMIKARCDVPQLPLGGPGGPQGGKGDYVVHRGEAVVRPCHQCGPCCVAAAQVVQLLAAAGAGVLGWHMAEPPLHCAAAGGCSTLVAALLQAGTKVGHVTRSGYSVLHAASKSGSLEVVQQVLSALGSRRAARIVRMLGSAPPGDDCHGFYTPLQCAVLTGYPEVVEALLAAGADVDQLSGYKLSALHSAIEKGHCHLVPLLLTASNVNSVDPEDRRAPLHNVAGSTHYMKPEKWRLPLALSAMKAVPLLLAAGADAAAKNKQGLTPLASAAAWGYPEVLRVLLDHELQQRSQQQQQQQQQVGRAQLLPSLLRELGREALAQGNGGTLWLLLTLAEGAQGPEGVRSLWGDMKQQLQQLEQPMSVEEGHWEAGQRAWHRACRIPGAFRGCWASACRDLAAQRHAIIDRLERLVFHRHHRHRHHQQQQQQQRGCASASWTSTQTRLLCEPHMPMQQQTPLPGASVAPAGEDRHCPAPCRSGSISSAPAPAAAAQHVPMPGALQLQPARTRSRCWRQQLLVAVSRRCGPPCGSCQMGTGQRACHQQLLLRSQRAIGGCAWGCCGSCWCWTRWMGVARHSQQSHTETAPGVKCSQ